MVDKTKSKNLGISLEGTVDVDDNGNETYPHHYIRSIMKSGPVDLAETKFLPGDELLEVDHFKLYAINYLTLLEILKGLKNKLVLMVCARKVKKQTPLPVFVLADSNSNESNKIGKIKAKSECFLSAESANITSTVVDSTEKIDFKSNADKIDDTCKQEHIELTVATNDTSKSDESPLLLPQSIQTQASLSKSKQVINTPHMCVRSRSLELNCLSLWNTKVEFINLKKSVKG